MVNGIYTATEGMIPRIVQLDNVANNLANVSTNGYKKSSVFLRSLISADQALEHAQGTDRTERPEEVWVDYTQGTFEETEEKLDIALNGSGFLRVLNTENNTVYYTRDGHFHRDLNGVLVNDENMMLLDDEFNIIIADGTDVHIMGNGDLYVDGEQVATIGLADFSENDYPMLRGIGQGLFEKPAAVAETISSSSTQFLQGYLEDANVDSVMSMVEMIEIFRAFELGQKAVQIQDGTLERVVTEVGSIS